MIITHAEIRDWRTHVRDQGATPDVLIIATKEKSINLAGVEYNLEGINTTKPIGKIDDLDVWVEKNSEVESICVADTKYFGLFTIARDILPTLKE